MNELNMTRARRLACYLTRELPFCFMWMNAVMVFLYAIQSPYLGEMKYWLGFYLIIPQLCHMIIVKAFKNKPLRIALILLVGISCMSYMTYYYILETLACDLVLLIQMLYFSSAVIFPHDSFKTGQMQPHDSIIISCLINCNLAFILSFFTGYEYLTSSIPFFTGFRYIGFTYFSAVASIACVLIYMSIERVDKRLEDISHTVLNKSLINQAVRFNSRQIAVIAGITLAAGALLLAVDFTVMSPDKYVWGITDDNYHSSDRKPQPTDYFKGTTNFSIKPGPSVEEQIIDAVYDPNTDPVDMSIVITLAVLSGVTVVVGFAILNFRNRSKPDKGSTLELERIPREQQKTALFRVPAMFLSTNEQVRRMFYDKVREHSVRKHKLVVLPSSTSIGLRDNISNIEDISLLEEAYRLVRYSGVVLDKDAVQRLKKGQPM